MNNPNGDGAKALGSTVSIDEMKSGPPKNASERNEALSPEGPLSGEKESSLGETRPDDNPANGTIAATVDDRISNSSNDSFEVISENSDDECNVSNYENLETDSFQVPQVSAAKPNSNSMNPVDQNIPDSCIQSFYLTDEVGVPSATADNTEYDKKIDSLHPADDVNISQSNDSIELEKICKTDPTVGERVEVTADASNSIGNSSFIKQNESPNQSIEPAIVNSVACSDSMGKGDEPSSPKDDMSNTERSESQERNETKSTEKAKRERELVDKQIDCLPTEKPPKMKKIEYTETNDEENPRGVIGPKAFGDNTGVISASKSFLDDGCKQTSTSNDASSVPNLSTSNASRNKRQIAQTGDELIKDEKQKKCKKEEGTSPGMPVDAITCKEPGSLASSTGKDKDLSGSCEESTTTEKNSIVDSSTPNPEDLNAPGRDKSSEKNCEESNVKGKAQKFEELSKGAQKQENEGYNLRSQSQAFRLRTPQPDEENFGKIKVTFHVIASQELALNFNKDQVFIVFGTPISHFDEFIVEMKPANVSPYGEQRELVYLQGVLYLSRDLVDREILYKYIIVRDRHYERHEFEYIYVNTEKPDFNNRCLKLPKHWKKDFHQIDDVIHPKKKDAMYSGCDSRQKLRNKASLAMLSSVNTEFIRSVGMSNAINRVKLIIKRYSPNGMKIVCSDGRFFHPGHLNLRWNKEMVITRYMKNILEAFRDQCKTEKEEGKLMFGFFLCHLSYTSEVTLKEAKYFNDIFNIFMQNSVMMLSSTFLFDTYPNPHSVAFLCESLVHAINQYFYILQNPKSDSLEEPGLWISCFPIFHKLKSLGFGRKIKMDDWRYIQNVKQTSYSVLPLLDYYSRTFSKAQDLAANFVGLLSSEEKKNLLFSEHFQSKLHFFSKEVLLSAFTSYMNEIRIRYQYPPEEHRRNFFAICCSLPDQTLSEPVAASLVQFLSFGYRLNSDIFLFGIEILYQCHKFDAVDKVIHKMVKNLEKEPSFSSSFLIWKNLISLINQYHGNIVAMVSKRLREHVRSVMPHDCLECLLEQGENIDEELKTALFDRAFSLDTDSYSWFGKLASDSVNFVRSLTGHMSYKKKNYVKILEKFILNFNKNLNSEQLLQKLCESEIPDKILEQVKELNLDSFSKSCRNEIERICTVVNAHILKLKADLMTVKEFKYFTQDSSLKKTHQVARSGRQMFKGFEEMPSNDLITSRRNRIASLEKDYDVMKRFIAIIKSLQGDMLNEKAFEDFYPQNPDALLISSLSKKNEILLNVEENELQLMNWIALSHSKTQFVNSNLINEINIKFEENDEEPLTPTNILELLQNVKGEIVEIAKQLSDESMTIENAQKLFQNFYNNNMIKEEISGLSNVTNVILRPDLVKRIEMIFKMQHIEYIANIVRELRSALELKEEMVSVNRILNATEDRASFLQEPISEINDDLLKKGSLFAKWSSEEAKCLDALRRSKKLVLWVKSIMHTLQELKVWVDLASISAGESDQEVDQVYIFQRAIQGYSALIFDLIPGSSSSQFLDACQAVFQNLESDNKIPQYIIDSARFLSWLQEVSDRHGSVEASSLNVVENVHKTGVFLLTMDKSKTFNPSLKYKVPGEEGKNNNREMTYEDILELRSKLMLVSIGEEGKRRVDRFVAIFSHIEVSMRLLNKIMVAGCHLFSQLILTAYFDEVKLVKMSLDFGHKHSLINGNQPVEDELKIFSTFLENSLNLWNEYICGLRSKFPSLNLFSTDQLVILSTSLAGLYFKDIQLSTESKMLLKFASKQSFANINIKVLLKDLIEASETMQDEDMEHDDDYEESEPKREAPLQHLKAFRELVDKYGYDKDVVLASFVNYECKDDEDVDIEACSEWCENNQGNVSMIKSILEQYEDDSQPMDVEPQAELSSLLSELWKGFMSNINEMGVTDFLDFRILSNILQKYVEFESENLERPFPKYMTSGRPNLIICPEKDSREIALSIYTFGQNRRLPNLDEFLICTPQTTAEQVELLCRRAFDDLQGKIYTILHSHLLNFDVSTRVEEMFSSCKISNQEYKIVFISSKEYNDMSYISTAFDKHTVNIPNPPSKKELSSYLKKHLTIPEGVDTAAKFDPERSWIRVVLSERSGNGKTLVAKTIFSRNAPNPTKTYHVHDDTINTEDCIKSFQASRRCQNRVFHLDVTSTVKFGKNDLLFSLCVLRGLQDHSGKVWIMDESDFYLIELLYDIKDLDVRFTDLVPQMKCLSPQEVLPILQKNSVPDGSFIKSTENQYVQLFDLDTFDSPTIQRPYQYLSLYDQRQNLLENFTYNEAIGRKHVQDALEILLKYCPVQNPTWCEIQHFASFLNVQLESTEISIYCDAEIMGEDLPQFKTFVVQFLIQMSRDFASRSVEISDQSHGEGFSKPVITQRRKWENSPHPYIFFNEDRQTISFFGFHLDRMRNLVCEVTQEILKEKVMSAALYQGLNINRVIFNKEFNTMSRGKKLEDLCKVFGVPTTDPDPTYELTYDNVMKMMAIHMRFRSNIPVVIMGETGSGKTRLIKFMCDLQKGQTNFENMLILKTHGGVTAETIIKKTLKAIDAAKRNVKNNVKQTILFFDEANTTNAIGIIKTLMCDSMLNGEPIPKDIGLQFVAAVNPYREHSVEMIKKLENAGLGYHISMEKTHDRIGRVPLRRLVYRVKEIPESMFPLVWDFGTLNDRTERIYIKQMITQRVQNETLPKGYEGILLGVLCESQNFMRRMKDECSFVSLRDVERTLKALEWFETKHDIIHAKLKNFANLDNFLVSLVLALGVAYYIRLEKRDVYELAIVKKFKREQYPLGNGRRTFSKIITACQDIFIEAMQLGDNIAKNDALKENVWIMSICIELKIPLFLVGKPGSSKSLAKTVIADAMQGEKSYCDLFKHFKDIQMISFQCSPLATANGILGTFRQCQKIQSQKESLANFSAVVVLDEIGLAEDSRKMPLKALHPLLEDGCIDDEDPEPFKKVSFIGISNWALDPAKMNRGILVSRGVPSKNDLIKSAQGICSNNPKIKTLMEVPINQLTEGYDMIHSKQDREYFGLRDYYSLIKMVFNFAKKSGAEPTSQELQLAVQRNFGGYFGSFDPAFEFLKVIGLAHAPLLPPKNLINEAIKNDSTESRYVLLLTKNNVALRIIQDASLLDQSNTLVIFGSSFPHDQEYTQICSNINRIKISMELGQTVVLCNLTNLYESLYDALNQNYVMMGGKRYVDLGLGTHRVKCRVHENFRLIVVAEDEEVYKKFPIPLINRLEKHFLGMNTMIGEEHQALVEDLKTWAIYCSKIDMKVYHNQYENVSDKVKQSRQFQPGDVFIGYNDDVIAAMVLRMHNLGFEDPDEIAHHIKMLLMQCATPDAVARISETLLPSQEKKTLIQAYHIHQRHESLSEFLKTVQDDKLIQITTSSRILTQSGAKQVAQDLKIRSGQIDLLSLQQFDTEEQFRGRISRFIENIDQDKQYLFVQAEFNDCESLKLVECARYIIQDLIKPRMQNELFQIVLILHIPRVSGGIFNGLSIHPWTSCHIDELRHDEHFSVNVSLLENETIHEIFKKGIVNFEALIKDCLPKAVSLVQCNEHGRMSLLIEMMIDLFDLEKRRDHFAKKFRELILDFVEHKILLRCNDMAFPRKWLINMTISSSHLKEGNTFQKSVWLFLCDYVVPILTKLITFCDLQQGLEFTMSTIPLMQQLYLDSLSAAKTQIDGLNFSTKNFKGKFPFSSFIISYIETNHEKLETTNVQLQAILDKSQLHNVFRAVQQNDVNLVEKFIFDFVSIKFPNQEYDKTEFLCLQLLILAKEELQVRIKQMNVDKLAEISLDDSSEHAMEEEGTVRLSLCDVHLAFVKNQDRLFFISNLIINTPELIQVVDRKAEETFASDLDLFLKFLSNSEPNMEQMVREQARLAFFNRMNQVSAFYHQYCTLNIPNSQIVEAKKEQIEDNYRRLKVLKIFIKTLSRTSGNLMDVAYSCGKRLNVVMGRNKLQTGPEFQKFITFLHFVNERVWNVYFKHENDNCIVCKEDMEDPVALPCKHVGCQKCLQDYFAQRQLKQAPRICPVENCNAMIEQNFRLESSPNTNKKVKEHSDFKNLLKEFFLDVLQRCVFVNSRNTDEDIIKILLSFVVTKELPKDDHKRNRTKQISPFVGHCIDVTPVIRSFILQLMLHGDAFELWYAHLEMFIEEERKFVHQSHKEFGELCLLIVYCLEDQYMTRMRLLQEDFVTDPTVAMDEAFKLISKLNLDSRFEHLGEILSNIARAKIAMNTVSVVLQRVIEGDEVEDGSKFLDEVERIICEKIQKNSLLKNLLVRLVVSQSRRDFILEWKDSQRYIKLLPDQLIQSNFENKQDHFLILGHLYKECRDLLKLCLSINKYDDLLTFLVRNPHLQVELELSLYSLRYVSPIKMENAEVMVSTLGEQGRLRKELEIAKLSLLKNDALRETFAIGNGKEEIVMALIKQLEVSFKHKKRKTIFSQIAVDPSLIRFMPTMPQDESLEVRNAAQNVTRWYYCPNGHPYGIGDCGQPVGQGRCGDCGAPIGAGSRKYAFDNGQNAEQRPQAKFQDQTKTGHVLGRARPDSQSVRERSLDGIQVAVTRFLLHASMSVACTKNQEIARKVVNPEISLEALPKFLMDHMTTNLKQISTLLGRNLDDAAVLMHSIISRMHANNFSRGETSLDTKEIRKEWEKAFGVEVINPCIQNLQQTVRELADIVKNDQSAATSALMVILHEESQEEFDVTRVVEEPCFWFPREKISIDNVACKIGGATLTKKCPLFSKLLDKRLILAEMRNLPRFIKMFHMLIKTFNHKIDSSKTEEMDIMRFVYQEGNFSEDDRNFLGETTIQFINAFNRLKNEIETIGKLGRDGVAACKNQNIGLESPAAFLFPSTHKSGSVFKALTQLLIQTHNEIIKQYCEANGISSVKVIPRADIRDDDVVVFDKNNLHLLLLANSEYNLNVNGAGNKTQWNLNESAFERDIIERYIAGRPEISEQHQIFVYQNDQTKRRDLSDIIPQTLLRTTFKSQMDTEIKKLVDVCDLLYDCKTLRDFLLVTGGQADNNLYNGMQRFHLKPKHGVRVLKQLHFGELEDLISTLDYMRAQRMIKFKQDPFGKISEDYRQELPDDIAQKQIPSLKKNLNMSEFLPKLHNYVSFHLNQLQPDPEGPLGGFLSYVLLEEDETSHLGAEVNEVILKDVRNQHAIDLFTKLIETIN